MSILGCIKYHHVYGYGQNVPQQTSILECDLCQKVIIQVTGDLKWARYKAVRQTKPAHCFATINKDMCHNCAKKKKNRERLREWSQLEKN